MQTLTGTPYFMAPEVIKQSGHGRKADVWSIGCTVVQMSTGLAPWKTMKFESFMQFMYFITKNADATPPLPDTVPELCRQFIGACLVHDPAQRPNVAQLLQHLLLREPALLLLALEQRDDRLRDC